MSKGSVSLRATPLSNGRVRYSVRIKSAFSDRLVTLAETDGGKAPEDLPEKVDQVTGLLRRTASYPGLYTDV